MFVETLNHADHDRQAGIVSIIEGIMYLTMSDEEFEYRYGWQIECLRTSPGQQV
ncbi:MAG: hypothetical protein M9928_11245 [Anaerolineae bacterium]|nr:hypothetical protein [Anaerolineae bacterium]MCO5205601.1 hypothetical protein [Anaerolineae bacterium]